MANITAIPNEKELTFLLIKGSNTSDYSMYRVAFLTANEFEAIQDYSDNDWDNFLKNESGSYFPVNEMQLDDVKVAVDMGLSVNWSNPAYEVIKDSNSEYLIKCTLNNNCVGLNSEYNSNEFFIIFKI